MVFTAEVNNHRKQKRKKPWLTKWGLYIFCCWGMQVSSRIEPTGMVNIHHTYMYNQIKGCNGFKCINSSLDGRGCGWLYMVVQQSYMIAAVWGSVFQFGIVCLDVFCYFDVAYSTVEPSTFVQIMYLSLHNISCEMHTTQSRYKMSHEMWFTKPRLE